MTFSSSGQFGHDAFLRAYNDLPIPADKRAAAVARWLDVSQRTVRDWVSGHHCPPLAVMYATWLESGAGLSSVAGAGARVRAPVALSHQPPLLG